MKRFLAGIFIAAVLSRLVYGGVPAMNEALVNGVVVATQTYTIDCASKGVDYISLQVNSSSVTYIPSLFGDGVKSTGTITVVTNIGVIGSTLTIQGKSYIEGMDYNYDPAASSQTAANLYDILSSTYGIQSNGYAQFFSTLSVAGSTVTFKSTKYVGGISYYVTDKASSTAANLMSALMANYSGSYLFTRSNAKITVKAIAYGVQQNASFSSSITTITVSAPNNGRQLPLSGIAFSHDGTDSVIYATATVVGTDGNYAFTSSVSTSMVVTGLGGGINSQIQYAPFYTVYSTQSYAQGLSVLFTVTSGSAPAFLTANTTYFVIPYDSTRVRLASTRDKAMAGVSLTISDINQDRGSFKITPVGLTDVVSPFGMTLQGSNDGLSWWNLSQSTITVYSTTTWTTDKWDIGKYNYAFFRCLVVPAKNTLGSAFLKIWAYCSKLAPY